MTSFHTVTQTAQGTSEKYDPQSHSYLATWKVLSAITNSTMTIANVLPERSRPFVSTLTVWAGQEFHGPTTFSLTPISFHRFSTTTTTQMARLSGWLHGTA